jgi:hypothetical protein
MEQDVRMWTGQGPVADSCEHSNEPSNSIKRAELLDHLYSARNIFWGASTLETTLLTDINVLLISWRLA